MDIRKLSELKEWDKNPRSISKDGIERLKKQIQKLGIYKPLVIAEDNTILGGNMRYKALQALGYKDVWVSVVKADTEEKKIEYALSDNDRAGQYEGDQLADLIGNFPDIEWGDYSVDIKPPINLKDLIDQYSEVVEDEVPEVPQEPAQSKMGEVYQLGRHRLMVGDATKIEDVEKLMDGKKADMVFTDPPYGISLDPNYKDRYDSKKVKGIDYGEGYGKDEDIDISLIVKYPAKEVFICGAENYCSSLPLEGSWVVWDKVALKDVESIASDFELVWSRKRHKYCIFRKQWFGFTAHENGEKRVGHPTQKPIDLPIYFMKRWGKENDIVLDLFGGSGSTLIACEQTNRICYMMEIDPKYCDVIRKRFDNFVNKK